MIGMILLTDNDEYLINGELPPRPIYDKELLHAFCYGQRLSDNALKILPNSIKNNSMKYENNGCPQPIGITIPEIANSNLIIVIRSPYTCNENDVTRKFRFDNHKCITSQGNTELWVKKGL